MVAPGQGTMLVSKEGNHPLLPSPTSPLPHWAGFSAWPSTCRLVSDILSPESLNLAAMDMKLLAVN